MKHPTKAGQKFTHHSKILTVKSFFGETGVEYLTRYECANKNPEGSNISILNEEHGKKGGSTNLHLSFLIKSP